MTRPMVKSVGRSAPRNHRRTSSPECLAFRTNRRSRPEDGRTLRRTYDQPRFRSRSSSTSSHPPRAMPHASRRVPRARGVEHAENGGGLTQECARCSFSLRMVVRGSSRMSCCRSVGRVEGGRRAGARAECPHFRPACLPYPSRPLTKRLALLILRPAGFVLAAEPRRQPNQPDAATK